MSYALSVVKRKNNTVVYDKFFLELYNYAKDDKVSEDNRMFLCL